MQDFHISNVRTQMAFKSHNLDIRVVQSTCVGCPIISHGVKQQPYLKGKQLLPKLRRRVAWPIADGTPSLHRYAGLSTFLTNFPMLTLSSLSALAAVDGFDFAQNTCRAVLAGGTGTATFWFVVCTAPLCQRCRKSTNTRTLLWGVHRSVSWYPPTGCGWATFWP